VGLTCQLPPLVFNPIQSTSSSEAPIPSPLLCSVNGAGARRRRPARARSPGGVPPATTATGARRGAAGPPRPRARGGRRMPPRARGGAPPPRPRLRAWREVSRRCPPWPRARGEAGRRRPPPWLWAWTRGRPPPAGCTGISPWFPSLHRDQR
jgi:hypothetical protein